MRAWLPALALFCGAGHAAAQVRVVITDAGPGASGPILEQALRGTYRLVEPDTGRLTITREVRVRGSLIVLGRTTRIEGTVDGDAIVVGGDLFIGPGGSVAGRAVAIGGGVYPSTLAHVAGEQESFRETTFSITRTADEYRLAYRSLTPAQRPLLFPIVYGTRTPQYDRVNGLSVPFGPAFTVASDRAVINVLATYRSNLGVVDPSVDVRFQATRRTRATLDLGRASFSNEAWIWWHVLNSFSALTFGEDTRNFYRANRAELVAYRRWEGERTQWEPLLGAILEHARSVGAASPAAGGPWSLFGREDTLAMRRPNPAIDAGRITSLLTGTALFWESPDLRLAARARAEIGLTAPADRRFRQVTSDVAVRFPTFGDQEYALDVHWVTTPGDTPPRQRYVYLGGAGTLPFLPLLTQAGDELLLVDQRYSIPLTRVNVGPFGNPALQFRHRLGAAGLGGLPSFETMLGVGLSLTVIRGEFQLDPVSRRGHATAGFTFSR